MSTPPVGTIVNHHVQGEIVAIPSNGGCSSENIRMVCVFGNSPNCVTANCQMIIWVPMAKYLESKVLGEVP